MNETFPFGRPIIPVEQRDRNEKEAFVLGVYASAVHAIWYSPKSKIIVRALAVDSEPEIFWRGENAAEIISRIQIPQSCGYLMPADSKFNGPSGRALDNLFLYPLRLNRKNVWLCDLLPKSRMNSGQSSAIKRAYDSLVKRDLVPPINFPTVQYPLANETRRNAIVNELKESKAKTLILLGDKPIEYFLKYYHPCASLKNLTNGGKTYGDKILNVNIDGYSVDVLPLVHPRQAGQLGTSSKSWGNIHNLWMHNCLTSLISKKSSERL